MAGKKTKGKSDATVTVKREFDVIAEINSMLPCYKANYIFFLYAKECLSYTPTKNTFAELKENTVDFPQDADERTAKQWLLDNNVQSAIKMLLERVNAQQMNDLYKLYCEKAKNDTNAFKALIDFCKVFFRKNSDNELAKILNNIDTLDGG